MISANHSFILASVGMRLIFLYQRNIIISMHMYMHKCTHASCSRSIVDV